MPEFIQGDAEPGRLADAVGQLLDDAGRREKIIAEFRALRTMLAQGADQKAAAAVLELAGA